jgi:hypothetical protein
MESPTNIKPNSLPGEAISYLLTEFETSISRRQNLEALLDREIQYYFTFIGVIIAGIGLIIQQMTLIYMSIGIIQAFALSVILAGYRLLRRIVMISAVSGIHDVQVALVRRFFVDFCPPIEKYIILPTASRIEPLYQTMTPVSQQLSLRVIPITNSIIASTVIVTLPIHFSTITINTTNDMIIIALIISTLLSLSAGITFYFHQKRLISRYGDELLLKAANIALLRSKVGIITTGM